MSTPLRYGVEQVDFSASPRFAVFDRTKGQVCYLLGFLHEADATRHAATLNAAYREFRAHSSSWIVVDV